MGNHDRFEIGRRRAMKDGNYELAADEVRQLRRDLDETQLSFATLIGVSQATVSNWESGNEKCRGPAALLLSVIRSLYTTV